MKILFTILLTSLLSHTANADMEATCIHPDRSTVRLHDDTKGFYLEDSSSYITKYGAIQPISRHGNTIVFKVRGKSNMNRYYNFKGMAECENEGHITTMKLRVFQQYRDGRTVLIDKYDCECYSD